MMLKTITKRAVDALRPGESIADDQLPGFVCRRLPSGRLTFGYRFTKDGRRRCGLAIGVGLAPEAARKAAARDAGSVAKDENPVTDREHRRRRALAARTLDQVFDGFIKERVHGRGLRSAAEMVSLLDRHVRPRLGGRPVEEIKRLEIVELLDRIANAKSARSHDGKSGRVAALIGEREDAGDFVFSSDGGARQTGDRGADVDGAGDGYRSPGTLRRVLAIDTVAPLASPPGARCTPGKRERAFNQGRLNAFPNGYVTSRA